MFAPKESLHIPPHFKQEPNCGLLIPLFYGISLPSASVHFVSTTMFLESYLTVVSETPTWIVIPIISLFMNIFWGFYTLSCQ